MSGAHAACEREGSAARLTEPRPARQSHQYKETETASVSDRKRSQTCVMSLGDESFCVDPSLPMSSLLLQAIGTMTTARPRRTQNAKPEIFRMFPRFLFTGEYSGGNSTV